MGKAPDFVEAVAGESEARTFEESPEVEAVARAHLERHLTLARLRDVDILYVLEQGVKPQAGKSREAVIDTIAKAMKVPPLWESVTGHQAAIVVNGKAWTALGTRQREAVVLHELLHLDVNDKSGNVEVLKHDVEEFGLVVAEYGPWHGGLERFGQQLGLFAESAARAA